MFVVNIDDATLNTVTREINYTGAVSLINSNAQCDATGECTYTNNIQVQ